MSTLQRASSRATSAVLRSGRLLLGLSKGERIFQAASVSRLNRAARRVWRGNRDEGIDFLREGSWEVWESDIPGVEAHIAPETLTWFSPPVVTVARGVAAEKIPTSRSHRPKQLACKLVTCECITQLSSEIRLQLSSSDLCQVVLLTSSLANEGHSIAAVLSHRSFWNNRHGCSQPTEVLLRRLFGPSPEEASPLPSGELLITAKGKCVLQNQQTPEESLFSLCLRTPEVSSVLLFSTTLLPIFERRSPWAVGLLHTKDKSGAVLRELPFLLLRYEAARVSSGPSRAYNLLIFLST
ncbi:unnamed protein product [Schistocephalus solidus]|uniref:Uncharacterized protein n=1 Tax=Schistocephalus solidus TaxID=70667 RepID=A0A183T026_SCHSO|nr:unnamed protein product [Schistocephalus solidus]